MKRSYPWTAGGEVISLKNEGVIAGVILTGRDGILATLVMLKMLAAEKNAFIQGSYVILFM